MNTPVSCCWFSNETKDCLPLLGGVQGQARWGCEQPGVVGGVPAYSRGWEQDDLQGLFQPKPFSDFIILSLSIQTKELVSSLHSFLAVTSLFAISVPLHKHSSVKYCALGGFTASCGLFFFFSSIKILVFELHSLYPNCIQILQPPIFSFGCKRYRTF